MCRNCSGVSPTEIRTLIMSSRIIPYICKDCLPVINNTLKLTDRVRALEEALSEIKVTTHKGWRILNC